MLWKRAKLLPVRDPIMFGFWFWAMPSTVPGCAQTMTDHDLSSRGTKIDDYHREWEKVSEVLVGLML